MTALRKNRPKGEGKVDTHLCRRLCAKSRNSPYSPAASHDAVTKKFTRGRDVNYSYCMTEDFGGRERFICNIWNTSGGLHQHRIYTAAGASQS
ncbi:surfactant-associated protein 3 isoform X2 [Theropithecus gelada]|uniref:surfactant-associated protein 3 isoform X2 n=1 Tax=Theropithecus gelada TaxID=9565 RepID=UPI000DC18F3F|nr:surfactant-associated protein 3 isoform X2 [Theropithecus gelada]